MRFRKLCAIAIGLIAFTISVTTVAQKKEYDLPAMLAKGSLVQVNRTPLDGSSSGKRAIRFEEMEAPGVAWLRDETFSNGEIELDIKGRDLLQKCFAGVAFHGLNDSTYDVVYFRPFNFRSDDPVRKIHAVQYVSDPEYGWKRLREERNGVFEKGIDPAPEGNSWFHARIVVKYPHVDVYVNGSQQASLSVDKLNNRTNGKIGIWIGTVSVAEFANLTITR